MPRLSIVLPLAAALAAAPMALPAQTGEGFDWVGPTPPAALLADPRFGPMLRWLQTHRHIPGTVPPLALPHDDSTPPIPLPPIEGLPEDYDITTPLPPAAVVPWMMPRWARPAVDADHDGTVTAEEAAAHAEAVFVSLDSNGDGTLSQAEFTRITALPFPGYTDLDNTGRQGRFDALDGNADGQIAKAEFLDVGRAHYEAARDPIDGTVTPWSYRRTDWY